MHFPNKKNSPFTKYRDMRETNKTRHKAFSVTNIEVNCRRISAGTAVEAKTGAAAIPLSSRKHRELQDSSLKLFTNST